LSQRLLDNTSTPTPSCDIQHIAFFAKKKMEKSVHGGTPVLSTTNRIVQVHQPDTENTHSAFSYTKGCLKRLLFKVGFDGYA
jgi:hypothetical protein